MKALKNTAMTLAALATLACTQARADEVDPSSLYEMSTAGTSTSLKAGEKGSFVLNITAKNGAHVSNDAPLKVELSGKNVTPEKTKLTRKDSLEKKTEGHEYSNPRFEVPIVASAVGKGSVDAKLTFFICTEKICSRQEKTLSVPVEVK